MQTITKTLLNKYVAPIVETFGDAGGFAARKILPRVPVNSIEYAYRQRDGSAYRKIDTKVGARGKAARLDSGTKWLTGTTARHFGGLFVPGPVLDEMDAQGIGGYMAEEAEEAMVPFKVEEEYTIADWMTEETNFTNKVSPGTKWNATGGNMQLDIVTKQSVIKLATGGHYADLLVLMEADYLNALVQYKDQMGHGLLPDDATLARMFKVKEILVVGAIMNTAKKGQADSEALVWNRNDATSGASWLVYTGGIIGSRSGKGFGHTAVKRINGQDASLTLDELKNPRGTDILIEGWYDQKIRNETSAYMFYGTQA